MSTILLTGATGNIGSEVLRQLGETSGVRVVALIRGKDEADVQARGSALLDWLRVRPAQRATIDFVGGDTEMPLFGVGARRWEELTRSVERVVHCAGSVHLMSPLERAVRSHCTPARTLVLFAEHAAKVGRLKSVTYVSTVGVAGRSRLPLPETRIGRPTGFHSTYEQAKFEAEEVIHESLAPLVPTIVCRPSMVVGDSISGTLRRPQMFALLCRLFSGELCRGVVPRLRGPVVDLVPVDFVASALIALTQAATSMPGIVHLSAGEENSFDISELHRHVRAALGKPPSKLPAFPIGLFRYVGPHLLDVAPERRRAVWRGIEAFLVYASGSTRFQAAQSLGLLSTLGVTLPPLSHYLVPAIRCSLTSIPMQGAAHE